MMSNELALPAIIVAAASPAEAAAIVQAYQRASKADATLKAYRGDAVLFQAWCAGYGFRSLPTSSNAVAGFLVYEAEAGRATSTIGQRGAAIRYAHNLVGLPDPTDHEDVRAAMKGIRRTVGVARSRNGCDRRGVGRHVRAHPSDAHGQAGQGHPGARVRKRVSALRVSRP